MVESPFGALLVPAIGTTPLIHACVTAAHDTAIALTAVTTRAEEKQRAACAVETEPLPQNHFAGSRHACSKRPLDNGYRFVAG
jgi:hypothetical protein